MDYLAIQEVVKKNQKRAFFLYAQDEQFIFQIRDLLRKKVLKEESSLSHIKLDSNRCTPEDLENALSTYSMFSEDIMVELTNAQFMEGSAAHPLKEVLLEYFKNPREDLFFFGYYKYENDLSKRNKYLEDMKKKFHPLVLVEGIDPLKGKGMEQLITRLMDEKGIVASKNLPIFINEVFMGNTLQLEKELDKLAAYADGRELKKEDVLTLMEISDERHIFNLISLIFTDRGLGRNIKEILNLVNDLIYRGEKPEGIMASIGARLRQYFKVKVVKEKRGTVDEVMKVLNTRSTWYAENVTKIASSITMKEYDALFKVLLEHEYQLKTSSTDTSALLEMLLIRLVNVRGIQ